MVLTLGTGTFVAEYTTVSAASQGPAKCMVLNGPKDLHATASTTIDTVEQGYKCVLANYVTGKTLDDRVLLQGAYSTVIDNLKQYGVPVQNVVPLKLTGNRTSDWLAFKRTFESINNGLPRVGLVQGAIAELSLLGMASALKDDHTSYLPAQFIKPALAQLNDGPVPSLGLVTSPITNTVTTPVFITDVFPHSPAADAGLVPGDTITQIDGAAPSSGGQPAAALINVLLPQTGLKVTLTIQRPSTGTSKTVTLITRTLKAPTTTSRLLSNGVAYVKLYEFTSHASTSVFSALQKLGSTTKLTGIVLDLRNNQGGDVNQATRLISAFVHNGVIGYTVNGAGKRTAQRTDDKIPLLHLPLTVLIDGGSASSSELIAGTVRDLHVGQLIGQRSAGALAEAEFFGLGDGSGFEITEARVLGPKAEKVDGIGIQPNVVVPTSAKDLSAGLDPAVSRAVQYLQTSNPTH
jgi:carboxyl-terminal processing protease